MSVSTHESHRKSPERKSKPKPPDREAVSELVLEINALQKAGEKVPQEMQQEALRVLPEAYNYFVGLRSPDMGKDELAAIKEIIDTLQAEKKTKESATRKRNETAGAKMRKADMEKAAGVHTRIADMADSIDRGNAGIHRFGEMVDKIDEQDDQTDEETSNNDWVDAAIKNKKAEEEDHARNKQLNEPQELGTWGKIKGFFTGKKS